MQDLTVYLLQDFFENTLSLQSDVKEVAFNESNSSITVCNLFHLRKGLTVLIDDVEYTVISVNHSEESFVVEGDLTGATLIEIPNPFFLWGTPIQANVELSHKKQDKYPFIYLKEIIREKVYNELAGLNREATISLFFLDEMNKSDYHAREFYSEVLIGLNKLVNEVIRQLRLEISNFYLVNTEFNLTNHSDFGLKIINTEGRIKALFSENLSAVELSFILPIKRGCKPCCNCKPKKINYMFEKYEFSTGAGETTKVLDFVELGIFTKRNMPFIFQLSKIQGQLLVSQVVGEGKSVYPSEEGSPPNTSADLKIPVCTINESDNTFSFTGLDAATAYQINVIQKQ